MASGNKEIAMTKQEMIAVMEKKHEKGAGLSEGGTYSVFTVKEGEGFIIFSVQAKDYNKGGRRNSGITIWEGWYAFDGEKEIQLIPMTMWRDGENQRNDKPRNSWVVMEIKGKEVIFRNCGDPPDRKTVTINFK